MWFSAVQALMINYGNFNCNVLFNLCSNKKKNIQNMVTCHLCFFSPHPSFHLPLSSASSRSEQLTSCLSWTFSRSLIRFRPHAPASLHIETLTRPLWLELPTPTVPLVFSLILSHTLHTLCISLIWAALKSPSCHNDAVPLLEPFHWLPPQRQKRFPFDLCTSQVHTIQQEVITSILWPNNV